MTDELATAHVAPGCWLAYVETDADRVGQGPAKSAAIANFTAQSEAADLAARVRRLFGENPWIA